MSGPIKFHERSKGCVEPGEFASDGVSIVEPRVKFVRGWHTDESDPGDGSVEVGPGTEYPLKVTPEELFEIFYRVKDAYFSEGKIVADIKFTYPLTLQVEIIPPSDPESPAFKRADSYQIGIFTQDTDFWYIRGYTYEHSPGSFPPAHLVDYFQTPAYTVTVEGFDTDFIDVKDDPLALWLRYDNNFLFHGRTAFTHDMGIDDGDEYFEPDYGFKVDTNSYGGSVAGNNPHQLVLNITNVAFLDLDGSGNPFSPLNEIYLGLEFKVASGHSGLDFTLSTAKLSGADELSDEDVEITPKFTLELSNNNKISCPLYFVTSAISNSNDPSEELSALTVTGDDFVVKAFKWWAYEDENGDPVWDEDTGERL